MDAFPVNWAGTQNNLAAAYSNRIRGERAENLELAIARCRKALKVRTFEAFPVDWAATQNNLGLAYYDRIRGDKAENLEGAIACYQQALKVRTFDAFPQDYAETLWGLGTAYQDTNQFDLAYNTFESAIATVDFLRGEIFSGEESKRKHEEYFNQVYHRMVETCLELQREPKAIEYIERSKTRNLVELLAIKDLYPAGEIPANVRQELQQLRKDIEVEKRRLAAETTPLTKWREGGSDSKHLNQLRQRYNELYPYQPIQYQQIQHLLAEDEAVIEWYIFNDCFRAFIITLDWDKPQIWHSSTEDLDNLVNWTWDEYLQPYYEDTINWEDDLKEKLTQLAEILHLDEVLSLLPPNCQKFQKLILVPHLYLHLLPLHALPITSQKSENSPSLLDLFPGGVSYAPSCQLLQQVQQHQYSEFQRLFAIQNPTKDLYEKDLGAVAAIKKQFTNSYILKREQAQKSAILPFDANTNTLREHEELLAANCFFCFCHGEFEPDSPLNSYLKLADDRLTLADIIAHFDLKNCRLVTLSACETGFTDFTNISDEYISLSSGFLLAGSSNVVSSLWTVEPRPTALLMVKFYEELQTQTNIAVALNTAQRWLRDSTVAEFRAWIPHSSLSLVWQIALDNYFQQIETEQGETAKPYESPYHWAAFCAVGKGV